MSDVVITVRGESNARVRAEEAAVRVTVSTDGPARGPVVERAQERAASVQDGWSSISAPVRCPSGRAPACRSGPIAPWNNEGAQLPLVHHAAVELSATFTDAGALSWWLGDVAESDDVQVTAVEWRLSPPPAPVSSARWPPTPSTWPWNARPRMRTLSGLASVSAVEIADAGLLAAHPETPAPLGARMMAASAGGPSFSLQPPEIVVTSVVEGRFRAE